MSGTYMSSTQKAFDILDCFHDDQQELGISDIAFIVEMPISSVHRIIQTLEFEGLLLQNQSTKKYYLGAKLMSYSQKCQHYEKYRCIAAKYIDELSQNTGETVNLSIYTGSQIMHIYHAESHYILRPNFSLYTPFSACNTSVGRVFLSHMSDAAVKQIYDTSSDKIDIDFDTYLTMIHKARVDGYALDDEDFNVGLRCVAAPIYVSDGKLLFAMSISAPISRMNDGCYTLAKQMVVDYANRISFKIQGQ